MPDMNRIGNEAQQVEIQRLNDNYGVARFEEVDAGEILVELDDGDTMVIAKDGESTEIRRKP